MTIGVLILQGAEFSTNEITSVVKLSPFTDKLGSLKRKLLDKKIIPESTITCPECGHVETEIMPTDSCQWYYECKACMKLLAPLKGDCCVYCSYATTPCPSIQLRDGDDSSGNDSCCT
jgi:hypothetical protein